MSISRALFGTLVGQKILMAATGILLYLYIVGHLLG